MRGSKLYALICYLAVCVAIVAGHAIKSEAQRRTDDTLLQEDASSLVQRIGASWPFSLLKDSAKKPGSDRKPAAAQGEERA